MLSCALAAGLNASTDCNASASRRLTGWATGVNTATHSRPARSSPATLPAALRGLGDRALSVILDAHVYLRTESHQCEVAGIGRDTKGWNLSSMQGQRSLVRIQPLTGESSYFLQQPACSMRGGETLS